MFRREVKNISELIAKTLRDNGLETPLLQRRTLEAWDEVVGPGIAAYTVSKYIRNQKLYIKIANPALRQDLSMSRTRLLELVVSKVGSKVITEIVFV